MKMDKYELRYHSFCIFYFQCTLAELLGRELRPFPDRWVTILGGKKKQEKRDNVYWLGAEDKTNRVVQRVLPKPAWVDISVCNPSLLTPAECGTRPPEASVNRPCWWSLRHTSVYLGGMATYLVDRMGICEESQYNENYVVGVKNR